MEKQHGAQNFNDRLTSTEHNSILENPQVLQSERELDSLLSQLSDSYQTVSSRSRISLVPTFVYEPRSTAEIARAEQAKRIQREAYKEALNYKVPTNCTGLADGTQCAGGKCFKGSCVMTSLCYDECCTTDNTAKPNGSPCSEGQCLSGKCTAVKSCYGDCCNSAHEPKPNNATCSIGVCYEGGCVATNVGCSAGACCDEVNGKARPAGFPCHAGQCQAISACTGFSHLCPETTPVADGSYCDGGHCVAGVCVKEVDPESKEPVCTEGECCDLTTFNFKEKGTPCSSNPCVSGSTCLGNSNQCPPPPAETRVLAKDGTACPAGVCQSGLCKHVIECEEGECCHAGRKVANYTACSVGRCFDGKCEYDKLCVGDCCEGGESEKALANGTPCENGSGICVSGRCRALPACMGDCCNGSDNSVAKPDGLPCNHGAGECQKGLCVAKSVTCEEGQCCDAYHGYAFPTGFPCHPNPCAKSVPCLGTSGDCPEATEFKPDGYPCPNNGTCEKGVCILPPKAEPECTSGPCCDATKQRYMPADTPCGTDPCKEMTYCTGSSEYCPITLVPIPDGTVCKTTALGEWTCVDGVCEKPKPKQVLPRCNVETACCDTFKQRVRANGTLCAEALNECTETAYCDGFDAECPISYKPDGAICTGGMCVHGQCILGVDPTDDDTTHEIHVHHTADGENELITVTTTRKSDGSTFTKEQLIDTNAMREMQRAAEAKARQALEEEYAKKKAEKERIRKEQFDKDVADTKRRIEEEEARRVANMTRAELEELAQQNKTANATSAAHGQDDELTDEEKEDLTQEHLDFVATLDHEGNPLRELKDLNNTHEYSQCTSGLCCNLRRTQFYPYGHICGQPKNPCQVAICSGQSSECYPVAVQDGFACPDGRCFEGECIKDCYGDCCDGKLPKADGAECEGDGKCFNGICVRSCYGDCCEAGQNFAKPDGAPCVDGTCQSGKCVKEGGASSSDAAAADGNVRHVAVVHSTEEEDALEEMWKKTVEEEHAEAEARREKEHAARKRALDAAADAEIDAISSEAATLKDSLKASKESSAKSKKISLITLACCGGVVCLLAVVLVIVVLVNHANKKKQAEKDAQDSEYYYEKF